MTSRRQGGGDAGVVIHYVEEPTTKPTNLAFECDSASVEVDETQPRGDSHRLWPVGGPKLLHDVIDVVVDGPFADGEDDRDVPGTLPLLEPFEDLLFPFRDGAPVPFKL